MKNHGAGWLVAAAGLCLAGLVSFAEEASPASPEVRLPIGMNLNGFNDWSPGYPFKNLMLGARPWESKDSDEGGPWSRGLADDCPLDSDGYPLEVPYKPADGGKDRYVFTLISRHTGPGQYVVLYDGEGDVTAAMESRMVTSQPGRVVLELKNKGYEGIAIKRSLKGNHVRNIRILALADEQADLKANPFREDFLAYCRNWHAIRYMDWMQTNNSLAKDWATRKPVTFYSYIGEGGDAIGRWGKPPSALKFRFGGGVPPEIMIQLANLTKTSPWFCMPHRATREYLREFAKLVKENLDPSLKVYVEYSNEVWNSMFKQFGWMLQSKTAAEGLAGSGVTGWLNKVAPAEFPYDDGEIASGEGADHPERTGVLMRRCFEPWEEVFSGDDRARLVRVVGVQHSWLDTARRTVKWVMEHGGADAMSPAGYIGPNNAIYERWAAAGPNLSADQVIADMNEAFEKDSAPWTRAQAEIAKKYNLRLVIYEGGQHIQPKGQAETDYMPALKAAQYHPGMYDLYRKNLALHREVGCDLFCAFNSIGAQGSRWGSWGHSEYYGQPLSEAPKLRALLDSNLGK